MNNTKIVSNSLLGAALVVLSAGALFFADYSVEAQDKKGLGKSVHDEQTFTGEKAAPTVAALDTFNDMIRRQLVAPEPNWEQILRSKGNRPKNSPAPIPPPAPDEFVRRNPGSFFDYDRIINEIPESPKVASPGPKVDFQGLGDANTSIPPDTHGAVGPNHVMTALNTQVRIQSRTGVTASTVTLNTFFTSVNGTTGTFDPRVMYDAFAGRWICVAVDDAFAATSKVLIAVSRMTLAMHLHPQHR